MAHNFKDLTGRTFGKWTVVRLHSKGSKTRWWCRCLCGHERDVVSGNLLSGQSTGCYECANGRQRGSDSPHWKGGRRVSESGYVFLHGEVFPGYESLHREQPEHRIVMARHLNRPLLPEENVHHINGVRDDNRIENLELWTTSQPSGKRVEDVVDWAREILRTYAPNELTSKLR